MYFLRPTFLYPVLKFPQRGSLEPLRDYPGASKEKPGNLSGVTREPLGGTPGPLGEFLFDTKEDLFGCENGVIDIAE